MAVWVGDHVRLVWGLLSGRDFAAIDDLVAGLIELDGEGRIDSLEIVAQADGGVHHIEVVRANYMTATVTTDYRVRVYAVGRPT